MKLEDLQRESIEDLHISIDNLEEESLRTPYIHNKYLKELLLAKDLYSRYESEMKVLKREKWLYYLGKASPETYKEYPLDLRILKTDVNMFIDSDPDVVDLGYKLSYLKRKIYFIDKVIEECNRRSFHITNAIKSLKFKNGEF